MPQQSYLAGKWQTCLDSFNFAMLPSDKSNIARLHNYFCRQMFVASVAINQPIESMVYVKWKKETKTGFVTKESGIFFFF